MHKPRYCDNYSYFGQQPPPPSGLFAPSFFFLFCCFTGKMCSSCEYSVQCCFFLILFIFTFLCCRVLLQDAVLIDNIWVNVLVFFCVQGNGPKCNLCKGYIGENELRRWKRRRRGRRSRRKKCFMFFMMCLSVAVLDWKWCLRKLSETTLTWRQMVMLCVTSLLENWKSIQNANNFMEKHIIRLSLGGYNSGTLEAIEFNIWTDVFSLHSEIMWTLG